MFSAKLPTLRPAACTALMCAGRYCRIFFEPYRVISVTRPGSFNGSSTLSEPPHARVGRARSCAYTCVRCAFRPCAPHRASVAAAEPAGRCLTLCPPHARCARRGGFGARDHFHQFVRRHGWADLQTNNKQTHKQASRSRAERRGARSENGGAEAAGGAKRSSGRRRVG